MEVTVEHHRRQAPAKVVKLPVLRSRLEEEVSPVSANQYDAIIIGAGHNGLIAGAYLARAGKKVVILERREIVGGAAVTEEIFPGYRFTEFSYVVSLLRPEIIRDLELPRAWLENPAAAVARSRRWTMAIICAAGPITNQRGAKFIAIRRVMPKRTTNTGASWRAPQRRSNRSYRLCRPTRRRCRCATCWAS